MYTPEPNAVLSRMELDKLVDGELSASDRRALVARIEAAPEGWKKCAIAFLEAQAWREALIEEPRTVGMAPSLPRQRRAPVQWLAIAACVAFAFLGGRLSSLQSQDAKLARNDAQQPATDSLAVEPGVRTLGQVAWPSQGAIAVRGVPSMLITLYEGAGIDDRWCAALPAVVPDLVAKQLERQGCKVREERRLVPLALADGRRLALRVDQLHFTLLGRPTVL